MSEQGKGNVHASEPTTSAGASSLGPLSGTGGTFSADSSLAAMASLKPTAVLWPAAVLVLLSLVYSYVMPLGYGPDEPRHYAFIRLLWTSGRLSRVLPDGSELGNAIAIHPPTYYLIEGLLWYPARALGHALAPYLKAGLARRLIVGAEPAPVPDDLLDEAVTYRLFRLTSPLWGLATLLLVFAALRRLMPQSPLVAVAVAWIMALWPHLLMNFATITNDCAANFAGALFVWYWACRAPQDAGDWRHAARAGAVAGLAGMMKGQLLLCLTPVTYVALAWPYGRRFWANRRFWSQATVATLLLLLIAGPWYARNFVLYGQLNYVAPGYQAIPRGMSFFDAVLAGIVGQAWAATAWGLFRSIWAQVGWFPSALAPLFYGLLGLLVLAAVVGIIIGLQRRRSASQTLPPQRARGLVALFLPYPLILLLNFYVVLYVHFGPHEGGRYHLFALPGLATALAWGWLKLPWGHWVLRAAILLLAIINVACVYNLLAFLNPTYGTTVLLGQ